jgi:hypothetical protein
MMFGNFHTTKAQYGARLLRINKEKGWLIPPPLHVQAPELVHAVQSLSEGFFLQMKKAQHHVGT